MVKEQNQQSLLTTLVEIRRQFHRYPEVSGQEVRTAKAILDFLRGIGVEARSFSSHSGVCAVIRGKRPGPAIALRADMDALSVAEENDVPYKSENPGVMHACGHDCHMAILLVVAKMFAARQGDFAGTVKFIFQPAEEAAPVGGAEQMMADGVLDNPKVDAIFSLHMWPDLPCGQIGVKSGPLMAASDRFKIKIFGKGSHAASPHHGVDAIAIATDIMQGLRHVMTRQISPLETATLSIGTISGGERYNVIAREVTLEGTVRTLGETVRQQIPEHIKKVLKGVTEAHGGSYSLEYNFGYPVLSNWPEPTAIVIEAAGRVAGPDAVITGVAPVLGGEDFARYLLRIPGAMFWLGCAKKDEYNYPLHSSRFDVDENSLLTGANVLYHTALRALDYYCCGKEGASLEPTA